MSAECGRRRRVPTSPRSSSRRRSDATTSRAARPAACYALFAKTRTLRHGRDPSARARRARPRARPLPAERADRASRSGPGETAQPLHPDDAIYPLARPHDEIVVNAMWPLCDFTAENGGTVLVPGQPSLDQRVPRPRHADDHDRDAGRLAAALPRQPLARRRREPTRISRASAWSALRGVVAAAGREPRARRTARRGARPPARLQELLGYNIHPPFIGYVDGRHPRKLLEH